MATFTFTNASGTLLPPAGTEGTTSQQIDVFGTFTAISSVSVTLTGLSHTWGDDLDFLLAGPFQFNNLDFFSDVGGNGDFVNNTYTITDSAAAALPNDAIPASGSYRPADYGSGDDVETGASFGSNIFTVNHAAPNGAKTFASAFGGFLGDGQWTLFMADDGANDKGSLKSWSLTIGTASNFASITGTAADDKLVVSSTGPGTGSFSLNSGPAVVYTGVDIVQFLGGDGNDTFSGGLEKDTVFAGDGNNTLSGGGGSDAFIGGADTDKLRGDAGDDSLDGVAGDDVLKGGAGADELNGGEGADRMYAGKGDVRDVFAYGTPADSGHGKEASWDHLFKFDTHASHEKVWDKIDLSEIDADKKDGDQHFRFVDHFEKAGKHQPDGEVRVQDDGKNMKVLVDVDGNKHADMVILVMHVDDLHKADFIL